MSNTDRTSGLQRILKQIEADGLETINKFDRETNDELKKRQTEIIADAQARANEIISAAKKRAAQTAENTKTGTEARIKKYILSAQSEILDECINLGITRIKHMPDEKYFDLIEKLIIKYSDKGINCFYPMRILKECQRVLLIILTKLLHKKAQALRFPMRELTQKADLLFAKAVR